MKKCSGKRGLLSMEEETQVTNYGSIHGIPAAVIKVLYQGLSLYTAMKRCETLNECLLGSSHTSELYMQVLNS